MVLRYLTIQILSGINMVADSDTITLIILLCYFLEFIMNKAELVEIIATSADISKAKANQALDGFINAVTSSLKSGDSVTLVGFGTFTTAERAERIGRNPATGKEIKIAASTAPKFKPGKQLKDAVAKTK